jgi:hypothetical protein
MADSLLDKISQIARKVEQKNIINLTPEEKALLNEIEEQAQGMCGRTHTHTQSIFVYIYPAQPTTILYGIRNMCRLVFHTCMHIKTLIQQSFKSFPRRDQRGS